MKHPKFRIYNTVNINWYCKVILTEEGLKVLKRHWNNYGMFKLDSEFNEYVENLKDKKGWYKFQLWDFMNIFGDNFHMGARSIIVNNNMKIYLG